MSAALRTLEAAGFKAVPKTDEFGPATQLAWLPIAQLRVDDTYQRPPTHRHSRDNIARIAAGFDWRRFAPVVVSPVAGGLYAIVDGQHRTIAALLCGLEQVPCAIILADDKQQAEAFRAINGVVTKVSSFHLWRARIAAADPDASRIAAVCERAGIRVRFNVEASEMKPGDTLALSSIEFVVRRHGDAVAVASLAAIRTSAGELAGYLRADLIRAVANVLGDHHEWIGHAALHDALQDIDLMQLRDSARTIATAAVPAAAHLEAGLVEFLMKRLGAAPALRAAE